MQALQLLAIVIRLHRAWMVVVVVVVVVVLFVVFANHECFHCDSDHSTDYVVKMSDNVVASDSYDFPVKQKK